MSQDGAVVKLDVHGPNNGNVVLIVDFQRQSMSLVEVAPQRQQGRKLVVWETQNYTGVGV